MTQATIGSDIDRRRRRIRQANERLTFAGDLGAAVRSEATKVSRVRFPSPHYRHDPVRYFREVLGVEPWPKQIEIIEAIRDHPRVAVSSGHKVSKSHTAAGIALWFYSSFDDARVVMSSTTARQVDQILWRELRMMRARSGRCMECKLSDPDGLRIKRPCPHSTMIEGEQGELARTGLKSDDFREVIGFTAKQAEAVAGISGRNLLYILDEASGIPDIIFEAIEGNSAGGARVVMFSNPTQNAGAFYDAFHTKKQFYKTLRVSSEDSPNVVQNRIVIPGLATREWIDTKREEWGEDSPLYRVRVKGEFATEEDGKAFPLHLIAQAQIRWHDTPDQGRLFIGIDPAGEAGMGDETCFAPRRGLKLLSLRAHRGLNEEQILVNLLALIVTHALPRETPVVVLDREGAIGAKVATILLEYTNRFPAAFELVTVRASERAQRRPKIYDRIRDELAANLHQWFRDEGAIVEDTKLEQELHALDWRQAINGRYKITAKDQIRKLIGRSPDRYDALSLSCWEALSLSAESDLPIAVQQAVAQERASAYAPTGMDPYAGSAAWQGRR